MNLPFVVTSGEPAGIGPDICLSIATRTDNSDFVIFGNIDLLNKRAEMLDLDLSLIEYHPTKEPLELGTNQVFVSNFDLYEECHPGSLNKKNSAYVVEMIESAVQACLRDEFKGCITAPVSKEIIAHSKFSFKGHTEFLGELCGKKPLMFFLSETMRVALATTHVSLKNVPEMITEDLIANACKIISHDLKLYFTESEPTIGILGLNPHAGENGLLGNEEQKIILPVIRDLQNQGLKIAGPLAADTAFLQELGNDIVLSLYHDQILPLFKFNNPHRAANVTLGLEIIRTSVDHGIALDQAGKKYPNNQSLHFALDTAKEMANHAEKKHNQTA